MFKHIKTAWEYISNEWWAFQHRGDDFVIDFSKITPEKLEQLPPDMQNLLTRLENQALLRGETEQVIQL